MWSRDQGDGAVTARPEIIGRAYRALLVALLAVSIVACCVAGTSSAFAAVEASSAVLTAGMIAAVGVLFAALSLLAVLPGRGGRPTPGKVITIPLGWLAGIYTLAMVGGTPSEARVFVVLNMWVFWLASIIFVRFMVIETTATWLNVVRIGLPWCVLLYVAVTTVLMWIEWAFMIGSSWWPFIVVLGVALACATVSVPLAARALARRRPPSESLGRAVLALACPHCGARQRLATGSHRCRRCRRFLVIELEEPRCACGYLLYRLAGATCPECGRAIGK
jgi:hypothetical protein